MNLLVVDDDLELCAILSRFFEKHGIVVHAAGDALEALELLQRQPIEFVITDLMMPHMDGISFVQALKNDARWSHLPVVMLTAYPSEEIMDKGLRKGAAFMLAKPIDFDRLLTLVRFAQ